MENLLSERIRLRRIQLGFSQEYMALKIGLSQQAYSKIEQHPLTISVGRLIEITKVLDLQIQDLFDIIRPQQIVDNEQHQSLKEMLDSLERQFKNISKKLDSID